MKRAYPKFPEKNQELRMQRPVVSTCCREITKLKFTIVSIQISMIKVLFDPRIDISQQALIEKYDALKALKKSEMKMYVAVNRLKEGLKLANKYKTDFKALNNILYKSEIKLCENIQDSINVLLDHFFGEEDERQGITMRSDKTLMSLYRQAFRYTANAGHTPASTEYALILKFESQVLENVNGFIKKIGWILELR